MGAFLTQRARVEERRRGKMRILGFRFELFSSLFAPFALCVKKTSPPRFKPRGFAPPAPFMICHKQTLETLSQAASTSMLARLAFPSRKQHSFLVTSTFRRNQEHLEIGTDPPLPRSTSRIPITRSRQPRHAAEGVIHDPDPHHHELPISGCSLS